MCGQCVFSCGQFAREPEMRLFLNRLLPRAASVLVSPFLARLLSLVTSAAGTICLGSSGRLGWSLLTSPPPHPNTHTHTHVLVGTRCPWELERDPCLKTLQKLLELSLHWLNFMNYPRRSQTFNRAKKPAEREIGRGARAGMEA